MSELDNTNVKGKSMLWPLILPMQITFGVLTSVVVVTTVIAPWLRWSRTNAFFATTFLAACAFIPSCNGIMHLVDKTRFGDFEFATFEDIQDPRARRYLPEAASHIKMRRIANGYRAQYKISATQFHSHLTALWKQYLQYSRIRPGDYSDKGERATRERQDMIFGDLGWKPLDHAIEYHSPSESDGGGAIYFFDPDVGVVHQRTGYW